jgi:restriction system protein
MWRDHYEDCCRRADGDAMACCFGMVLAATKYPICFPGKWKLDYVGETKVLLVDFSLPNIEDLRRIKAVRGVKARGKMNEVYLADRELKKLYDNTLYQAALLTIHELLRADANEVIQSVVFNGWVRSTDKRTGHEVNACIMSLQVGREEFKSVKLAKVDPKECFRFLKGVAGADLHGLAPVAPLMHMDREDKRFVQGRMVAGQIQEGDNIAAMAWEDFEHLVRELFESYFAQCGGEVKVTRGSRDGGVDAVAFDPDPLRGGKIVIQAKRYTNVVGVSAVRDLYGTLINEGATKGILVTTSYFGADAYEFAKGKPISLLDGGNLLSLLEKYGRKARIDLAEAKRTLAEQERAE